MKERRTPAGKRLIKSCINSVIKAKINLWRKSKGRVPRGKGRVPRGTKESAKREFYRKITEKIRVKRWPDEKRGF